ncbi:capsule assembly Wzi family protein [Algoriphagus terrigena]|uniref:capsule assembly Wzi family protein n=1 Tax=Algoriphagus terrigena TaxID=344884 RepID=UPI0003F97265|nr:capsule assembly Wzi family protein [Algoriphagus terrigena]
MKYRPILFLLFLLTFSSGFCQTIPLGFPVLNEYLRREQILGNLNPDFSFNYRPILVEKAFPELNSLFVNDSSSKKANLGKKLFKELKIGLLPVQSTIIYNAKRPYGWGNGAAVPSKGGQVLVSAGTFLKWGPLRMQLYPQVYYAQNLPFQEYPKNAPSAYFQAIRNDVIGTDKPVRYGTGSIKKFLIGDSNIMLDFGSFAAGVSTENVWWGPGTSTALLLSDNAEGFLHATIKTTRPAKTFLGNFEGEYFAGSLEGSELPYFSDGYLDGRLGGNRDDESFRYFTGLSITYSPKWVNGLSIGGARTFQVYEKDMGNNFRAWFPLLDPLPKDGVGNIENIKLREDQHFSLFFRWFIPKIQFEFYGEFMKNDHNFNWRDVIMNPEHSRGYILGFTKYVTLPKSNNFLELHMEMIQTQNSINRLIRYSDIDRGINIYYNGQVTHGLTNKGQVLGSGLGLSGNLQKISISKVNEKNKIGIQVSRLVYDPHSQLLGSVFGLDMRPWVDFSGGIIGNYSFNNHLLFSGGLNGILTLNENWLVSDTIDPNIFGEKSPVSSNFNFELKIAYIF